METNKILSSNLLDIIFDGKNKLYGAYELRTTYNSRLTRAVIITGSFVLLVCVGSVFAGKSTDDPAMIEVIDHEFGKILPEVVPPAPPLPPPVKPVVPELNQVKFISNVVIVKDNKADEKIETVTDETAISTITVASENTNAVIEPPVTEISTGAIEKPVIADEDKVWLSVEKDAEFPNGTGAWARYLKKNLNPSTPVDNNAPAGTYKVIVQFIVSKDGSISDVHAVSTCGFGMEAEAEKIIKRGPKWIPGLQNGQNVNSYRRQPITFLVEEQ